MKKRAGKAGVAAVLAATAMLAAVPVYAEDTTKQSEALELKLKKDAEYVLRIPKSISEIKYAAESTAIGDLIISGDIGSRQIVTVTATKEDFQDQTDAANTIPFALKNGAAEFTSEEWGRDDVQALPEASKKIALTVDIPAATWNAAVPGIYKGKITFRAVLSDQIPGNE